MFLRGLRAIAYRLGKTPAAEPQALEPPTPTILIGRADLARDELRFQDAATLYGQALQVDAGNGPIHVQAGHMFKESGDLVTAERHYTAAADLMPDDADLALQLGHFFKVAGRLDEAEHQYRRALALKPFWKNATRELEALGVFGLGAGANLPTGVASLARTGAYDQLAPELMPQTPAELLRSHGESIHLRRLGRKERSSRWGVQTTLRGVEAIRGLCISADPILKMQILLDGELIYSGDVRSYPLKDEAVNPGLRKYVFNAWLDFTRFPYGRHSIELRFQDANDTPDPAGGRRWMRELVVIAEPMAKPTFEGGDGWTPSTDPYDPRPVDEQVNARPSKISSARRQIFKDPPANVLVLRTDQLGDVVASIPALRRLRELLPHARLVGLFTSSNADLARTLGVLDDIIVIDFPDEKETQRKRVMTAPDQETLRLRLAAYQFELAIDLAPAVESRPLLLLSGAPFLMGMRDKTWPYIDAGFDFNTYDAVGRSDIMPASSKTLAFIEALGIMMNSPAEVIRRPDLSRDMLLPFGIEAQRHYIVLHTGARVVFSRWAHYLELAERVLDRTDCKIVMLSDDPDTRSELTSKLLSSDRFQLLDKRLPFDDFDALLSYCTVFVGNDSGPKHLASLRGANVVSLHTPRINWGEWGQEQTGSIIHRQVPCAGCHIYHDPEECGRDYVCVSKISVDEVWTAMQPFLPDQAECQPGTEPAERPRFVD